MLYIIAFAAIVLALLLWSSFNARKANRIFQGMTLLAILTFLGSWLAQAAPLDYKFEVLARDLLVIGAMGAVFTYVAQRKKLFFVLLIATVIGGYFYIKTVLQDTFPFQEKTEQLSLASDGELLVELKHNLSDQEKADLEQWMQDNRASYQIAFPEIRNPEQTELDDFILVDLPNQKNYSDLIESLQRLDFVEYTEQNEQIQLSPIEQQKVNRKKPIARPDFGLNDPGVSELWSFPLMEMDRLYRLLEESEVKPKKKALVAILDTGVDAQHEDLKANFKSVHKKSDSDVQGHGTHCAGIAGAVSNNGKGRASYSRDNAYVQITSVQVLNNRGMGTQQSIIKGITTAADAGVDVISMSLGGPSNDARQRAYSQAVAYANQKGVIVVAAAGNSNANSKNYSPVNAKNIIGVSAVDRDLKRASFSNTVQDIELGIAAPGVGIYSTIPNNKYAAFNGTSMATPYVSGLIGLMKSLRPELTTQRAHEILSQTGVNTQSTTETGSFIQPAAAVELLLEGEQ
jgi:thermitase